MHLVAIAWMYVVVAMSIAEAASPAGSLLGAAVTFVLYGMLPLAIVLYVLGTPGRRRQRAAAAAAEPGTAAAQGDAGVPDAAPPRAPIAATGDGAAPQPPGTR